MSGMQTADVGEIPALQRAAFVTEALLYGGASLLALVQTYDALAAELEPDSALKAVASRCPHPGLGR